MAVESQLVTQPIFQFVLEEWIVRTQNFKVQRDAEHIAKGSADRYVLYHCAFISLIDSYFSDSFCLNALISGIFSLLGGLPKILITHNTSASSKVKTLRSSSLTLSFLMIALPRLFSIVLFNNVCE